METTELADNADRNWLVIYMNGPDIESADAWGPGRHGVGSNYFHYFRDPWNGMAEYFHDMDYIPESFKWEAKEWTKKDGMFL